ncbi:MAG: efflux RND transporter periplasmic adaptor subunit [Deltaproteobacteria bacterium]|nr:efflux RND transporter periplasmic adaptor subunit [Deltaproteobacteria bacterium]
MGCSRGPGNGKIPVTVEKVFVQEKQADLSLSARLEPAAKATYTFPMEVKIDAVPVRLGEMVPQENTLFELDELDLSLKMAGLKAKRQEIRAGLDKNKYFLENRDRLLEEGKIDQVQYDALEMEVKKTEAEWDHLNAEVSLIENQTNEAVVRAPFTGIVSTLQAAAGTRIPAGETIVTLVQINPIHVTFLLPAEEAPGITTDMPVQVKVEGFGEQAFSAPIVFISPEINTADKTLEVKAALSNETYVLRGGLNAEVYFTSRRPRKILSIPRRAVITEAEKKSVFLIRQNKAWPVRIYTRETTDPSDMVEVLEGLKESDLVVVEGQEKLSAGAEVNLWR